MIGSCAVGALVFLLAAPLSVSTYLRVTSGGLLFALGSAIIVIYVLARQMPGRRSMLMATAFLGTSWWTVLYWLTGHWMPSLYALLHNRWLLGYMVVAGLLGAALTYLYGGVENTKLNTLVRVGLRLLGLILLYTGLWTQPSVFATVVALAVTLPAVQSLSAWASRLSSRRSQAPRQLFQSEPWAAAADHPPATPLGGPSQQHEAVSAARVANVAPSPAASIEPFTPVPQQYASHASIATPERTGLPSPLLRSGMIINPLTGRPIEIGGEVYNALVDKGYTVDMVAARLRSP